jgi:putative ABC transport system permease protein
MFLAIKEMLHEKLRYSLIIVLIFLVSYLLIILTGLATGLSTLNKSAVNEWHASSIVLNSDSEGRLPQSFLSQDNINRLPKNGTKISQYSMLVKSKGGLKENAQLIAVDPQSFVYKNLKLTSGSKNISKNFGLVSDKLKDDGFKIGDYLTVANSTMKIKITGFTSNATLSALPVIYISSDTIQPLNKGVTNAVLFKDKLKNSKIPNGLKQLNIETFINKLPGYSAQQLTFNFMISFLYIIILIVISIFFYTFSLFKSYPT